MLSSQRKPSTLIVLIVAALLLFLLALDGLAMYRGLVQEKGRLFDFFPRWLGARAMLFEGENPYSEEMTQRIRTEMGSFGRHSFLYPAFIAFTVPHFLLPFPWAITVWLVTLHVFLILSIIMLVHGRQVSPIFLACLILAAVIYPLNITTIMLGQFTLYILFFLVLAYWLWTRGHYALAGCALTQVLIKPQLTFLIVACWLLLALKEKKWIFLVGFGITIGVLTLLPMFFVGNWLDDFLLGSSGYEQSAYEVLPQQAAFILQIGLIVILWPLCLLLWLRPGWSPLKRFDAVPDNWRLGYLISLTLVVTFLTTPRVRNYDLALATFVVVYGLLYLRGQKGTVVMALRVVLWGVLFVAPWVSAWLTPDHDSSSIDRLTISGILLAVLLLLPRFIKAGRPERTTIEPLAGQI